MSSSIDQTKITAMRKGGLIYREIKKQLQAMAQPGVSFEAIEAEAQRLIKLQGCKPNFAMVEGYHWATCIVKNEGMCHGIPKYQQINDGDVISIDGGVWCDGYNLDSTITFPVGEISGEVEHFLSVGKQALRKAISRAQVGASVYDISYAMQKTVERHGFGAVYQLTGHGLGKSLHEDPSIPCIAQKSDQKIKLYEGQTIAIEVMYTMGDPELVVADDGWTFVTADGSMAGMFEETVLVTAQGPEILT